jgi:acyl carrier protein
MQLIDSPVAAEVLEFIRARVKSDKPITLETRLTHDLALDSLAAMELILELEARFDIDISLSEMPDTETIGDLANVIDRARLSTQKA